MTFLLGAYVIPKGSVTRLNFENIYKKKKKTEFAQNVQLQVDTGVIAFIEHFDGRTKTGYHFSLDKFVNKKLVDRMLRTYDVTSNQCVKIVKEISYTPDQVEMMKKLYPYVRDKRNFNKVIDILFSNAYKDEMRKFIEEYHQNNK
jgi:ABC-type lipopolysaccharide export system ATPase subunit